MSKDNNNKENDGLRYDEHGIRLFGPVPEDKDAEDREHRKAQRTYEDKQTALQAGILRTQIALVVFGLIGAGISAWQAKTAQESSETAESSVLLAQKTERDGNRISQMQVQISKDSLRESVENFHSDQRPWIFIKALQLVRENQAGKDHIKIYTYITNTGRSPSFDTQISNFGSTVSAEASLDVDGFLKKHKEFWGISNSGFMVPGYVGGVDEPPKFVSDQQFSDIKAHKLWVYAFGDIRYVDSAGIRYFTQYCGVYNPDAQDMDQFTTCKGHNYVDRNK